MLSPTIVKGINTAKTLRPLSVPALGIAFHIFHSNKDEREQKMAEKLFRFVQLKGEEYDDVRSITALSASGEGFLTGRVATSVREDVQKFFKKNLTELQSPWRSRRSKLAD